MIRNLDEWAKHIISLTLSLCFFFFKEPSKLGPLNLSWLPSFGLFQGNVAGASWRVDGEWNPPRKAAG